MIIMEFEELRKIWDAQNNRPLYAINEKAMYNLILSKKKQAHHITNISELLIIIVYFITGSFVFGMDEDDESVFARTVDWAISQGIETATFHILTPYPSTDLYTRMEQEGRLLHSNWDLYDTRHAVYRPKRLTPEQLEAGYWRAYKDFYRWGSIFRGASAKSTLSGRLRHFAYAARWKKFEPLWDLVIRARQLRAMTPILESVLAKVTKIKHGRPGVLPLQTVDRGGSGARLLDDHAGGVDEGPLRRPA